MGNDFCKVLAQGTYKNYAMKVSQFYKRNKEVYCLFFYKDNSVIFEGYYNDIIKLKEDFINMQELYFGIVIQKYFTFERV